MNSVKNLFVIVLLMGVSYGAIQVINAPDPTLGEPAAEIEEIDIQIGTPQGDTLASTTGDSSDSQSGSIELPPLPPGIAAQGDLSTPPGGSASQLQAPPLSNVQPPAQADPYAFSPPSMSPPEGTQLMGTQDQSTIPPAVAPEMPSMDPLASRTETPPMTGQFNPGQQTPMQPVSPRQGQFAPPASTGSAPPSFVQQSTPATSDQNRAWSTNRQTVIRRVPILRTTWFNLRVKHLRC